MKELDELMAMPVEERSKLPWNDSRLDFVAKKLEEQFKLPEDSLRALKYAENTGLVNGKISLSKNDSTAVSPAGARGIMQIMPSTMELQGGKFKHNHLDPVESLYTAASYLSTTMQQYKGNVAAAFADYNGGPKAAKDVLKGKRPKNKETNNYLTKIEKFYEERQ